MAGGAEGRWAEGLGCDAVNLVVARVGVFVAWSSVTLSTLQDRKAKKEETGNAT